LSSPSQPQLPRRILTSAVALPVIAAAMFLLPNALWSAALAAPLLVAGHEWARLAQFERNGEWAFIGLLAVACALLGLLATRAADRVVYAVAVACWCVVAPCWMWLKLKVCSRAGMTAAGAMVLLPAWLALARLQQDAWQLLLLLTVVWIADSAAYFAGHACGRRKLAPSISPGKTWEGVGGAFAAVAVYAWLLRFAPLRDYDGLSYLLLFFAMTVLSIVGDLFESWLKRCAGVKDSGSAFPGHGGMLDRIDGVSAAMPLAALIFH